MDQEHPLYFETRKEWKKWLSKNYKKEKVAWLLFYKVKLGKGMTYIEALEEAICYGWIDGRLRSLGEEKHMIRFTPRREKSNWSEGNKARAKEMYKKGTMIKEIANKLDFLEK